MESYQNVRKFKFAAFKLVAVTLVIRMEEEGENEKHVDGGMELFPKRSPVPNKERHLQDQPI